MFNPQAIFLGLVCSLDAPEFKNCSQISLVKDSINAPGRIDRAGPFVCVGILKSDSQWAEITTQCDNYKLPIKTEWRSGCGVGCDISKMKAWMTRPQCIHGAVFQGPTQEFAKLSQTEDPHNLNIHRMITSIGMDAVRVFLTNRGNALY